MDATKYISMLQDKHFSDLKKMEYKYSKEDVQEMLGILKLSAFKTIPLHDFSGASCFVYVDSLLSNTNEAMKTLMSYKGEATFGLKSLEDEIISTLLIEQIDTSRDSVRKILSGAAPRDEAEHRIWGMKKGFEFISNPCNRINAESFRELYEIMVNPYLSDPNDQLSDKQLYRHGSVSVVDQTRGKIIHNGLDATKLPDAMDEMFAFVNQSGSMDDLSKASALHFHISYLHPFFDGNGRMARMLHLWFLIQRGYSSALFMPFSSLIQQAKSQYYKAFSSIEDNAQISGLIDITPFLKYFNDHVYRHIGEHELVSDTIDQFTELLKAGAITAKEKDLFHFVLSKYGKGEFSTKQIERDYGNCAYATIRSFVLKLSEHGILEAHQYGNRVKYCIASPSIATPKLSLNTQIQSASTRAGEYPSISHAKQKESEPEL